MTDVEVVRIEENPRTYRPGSTYYAAAVILGGVPWSFRCAHGHMTARAAERCVPVVERVWEMMDVEDVRLVEPGLVEISYRHRNPMTDRSMVRRLRARPEWIRVETAGQAGQDRGTVSP